MNYHAEKARADSLAVKLAAARGENERLRALVATFREAQESGREPHGELLDEADAALTESRLR